jgi:PAS domain S-box-containing protein
VSRSCRQHIDSGRHSTQDRCCTPPRGRTPLSLSTPSADSAAADVRSVAAPTEVAAPRWRAARDHALLLSLYLLSALVREQPDSVLQQAVVWLPSGVAIAGLWLLGLRAAWIIALGSALLRWRLHLPFELVAAETVASVAEALVGALLLRRFKVEPAFARLRDVVLLFVISVLAPLASILCSWIGRWLHGQALSYPFHAGWDGWWRMNQLGVMVVVPLAGTWYVARGRKWRVRAVLEACCVGLLSLFGVATLFRFVSPGPLGIVLLYLVLPLALYAAVRFSARGGASTAALAGLAVAVGTSLNYGPFLSVQPEQRHAALQVFVLSLVTVPLVCGALIAEREHALASRLRSDAVRQAMQRFLPDAMYRLHADGRVLEVYAADGRSGPPAEATFAELLPRAVAAELPRLLRRALDGASTAALSYEVPIAGRRQTHEARFVRLADDEVLGLVHDVTERERSARAAQWESRVLMQLATGNPSSQVLRELVLGIEASSDGGLGSVLLLEGRRLRGASAPSLPAAYCAAIDGLEIGPGIGSCGSAAHSGRAVIVGDIASDSRWSAYAALAASHSLRACWSVPILDTGGHVLGTFAVYYREPREPTGPELALVERAAALAGIALERDRREGLLASIHRSANEGIFRCTPDLCIVHANEACVRMLGFESAADLQGAAPHSLYVLPDRRAEVLRRIAAEGGSASDELQLRRRDGSTFWARVNSVAVLDADGQIVAYDSAVSDIAARRKLEEELRQAQKMEAVGRLAGGIAHDFNNLLTAISGYTEALLEELPPATRGRHDAEQVLVATERAAGLTRQLLAFSRRQVLAPQLHDLSVVVDQLGQMLRRLIGEHIQLTIRHTQRGLYALVDRGQLEQVVLNLALNSRDAMPAGGDLTIVTEAFEPGADSQDEPLVDKDGAPRHGPHVRLSVSDTGHGMDAETQARAFDPFFTTKDTGKGTGLGLSTVYGIVRQSDGSIALRSTPGNGTTVSVYLPRRAAPAEAPQSEPGQATTVVHANRSGATILVAEDELSVREILIQTLAGAGFRVLQACDGEQALELASAAAGALDLVVTDMIMPRMGGRELAQRLRQSAPELPVLVVSGYAPETAYPRGDIETERHFLQKPFTREQLLQRVQAILARTRA